MSQGALEPKRFSHDQGNGSRSRTSFIQHNVFHRVYEFPALLDARSSASSPALSAENVDRVEHHHVRRLRLLQTLMTSDLVKQLRRREGRDVSGV